MKKFLKDAMIVSILVTSILMLVLVIGILSPVKHDLSEIVHIRLGNGFLTIPRGYLVGVMRAEDNGFIELKAMFPNLEPMTEQNKEHFEGYKPEIVTVYVDYDKEGSATGKEFIKNLNNSHSLSEYLENDSSPVPKLEGYKPMKFGLVNKIEYISVKNKSPFLVSCDDEEHKPSVLKIPNPSCSIEVPISSFEMYTGPGGVKYHIRIRVQRKNLNQIPEVTQKIDDLISKNFQILDK